MKKTDQVASINEVLVDGELFVRKADIKINKDYTPSPVQILVLNRGWIVVGNVQEVGQKTIVQNASVIRNWGTKNGLGELALNGKLPETRLDPCPDITVETCNVVLVMNCEQSKW